MILICVRPSSAGKDADFEAKLEKILALYCAFFGDTQLNRKTFRDCMLNSGTARGQGWFMTAVLYDGGDVAGAVTCNLASGKFCEIVYVAVAVQHQLSGNGRKLVAVAASLAQAAGVPELVASAATDTLCLTLAGAVLWRQGWRWSPDGSSIAFW